MAEEPSLRPTFRFAAASNGIVGAVLVIRDITALQELDRKKDEFLSVASHELRTPLTTIKGYTQLLSQTLTDLPAEERSTYLNAVLGEIDRMMGLISELLDVSRIETNRLQIHPQPIRWIEFIERRAAAFRVQNPGRGINFDAKLTEGTVNADPDRMRQVIDNLLSNAIKYSPDGSEISVEVAFSASIAPETFPAGTTAASDWVSTSRRRSSRCTAARSASRAKRAGARRLPSACRCRRRCRSRPTAAGAAAATPDVVA